MNPTARRARLAVNALRFVAFAGALLLAGCAAGPGTVNAPSPRPLPPAETGNYQTEPGRDAAIVADRSIKHVTVVGDLQGSEIKAGANYTSFAAGLEPVRASSRIRPIRVKGNLIDSDVTSTYRTGPDRHYGTIDQSTGRTDDEAGNGLIRGKLQHGALYGTGGQTALSNTGVGFYARRKIGYLPPPERAKRIHGVNTGF